MGMPATQESWTVEMLDALLVIDLPALYDEASA